MPNPKSTAAIAGHPIHPMLIPFPIVCFVLTFISDLAFWKTSNDFWTTSQFGRDEFRGRSGPGVGANGSQSLPL